MKITKQKGCTILRGVLGSADVFRERGVFSIKMYDHSSTLMVKLSAPIKNEAAVFMMIGMVCDRLSAYECSNTTIDAVIKDLPK